MNGHTEMPTISFGDGADYDTMHAVLDGWCCRVWLTDGVILVAEWIGPKEIDGDSGTELAAWNNKTDAYDTVVVVRTDNIRKIEVL